MMVTSVLFMSPFIHFIQNKTILLLPRLQNNILYSDKTISFALFLMSCDCII